MAIIVMIPRPPTCIRKSTTSCPKMVKSVFRSNMLIPVTLTILTDMKSASKKETSFVPVCEMGSMRRSAPNSMKAAKPPQMRTPR